jgi:hypothetical protein
MFNILKPTQTDLIIPNNSCYPYELKLSGINYLLRRLHKYPTTDEAKDIEMNTIRNMLRNDVYDIKVISKLPSPIKQYTQVDSQNHKTKWATFTYSGKEVRKVANLFRDTNIKMAFRTRNQIDDILRPRPQRDKYNRSGIFRMKCMDCPQTGRSNNNTGYANHILNTGHTYGTITDTMEIINTGRKGRYLN